MNDEVYFCKVIHKLKLSCSACIGRHAQSTQNKKFLYLCNISRKTWKMKLIFCFLINIKVFCKMIVSHWVCIARHAQSTQKISLQYLKENVKGEIDFLPVDKHQRFLQIDTIILDLCGQASPNYPK